ncbi:hypothetical protein QCA50_004476 [Cerrena zonata]|uniref:Uncharacterized protein n=1 Tax=Cerrena zonata TaxID=2478898 RepID=A0AAW0GHJ4_9APHY
MNFHSEHLLTAGYSRTPTYSHRYHFHRPPSPMPYTHYFPTPSSSAVATGREYLDSEYDLPVSLSYPVSSVRDEPYHPTSQNATPSPPSRELVHSTYPRPLYKGVMSNHAITVDNPYVDFFISLVPPKPNYILVPHEDPEREEPEAPKLNELFTLEEPLSPHEEEIIWVLAACKLYTQYKHPKHFTFWSELVWEKTLARVHSMLNSDVPYICIDVGYFDLCILQSRQCSAWGLEDILPVWSKYRKGPTTRQTRNAAARAIKKRDETNVKANGNALEANGARTATKRKQLAKAANKSRKKVKIAEPSSELAAEVAQPEIIVIEPTEPDTNSTFVSSSAMPAILESTATREAKLERMGTPSIDATLTELPDLGLSPLKATKSRNNRSRKAPAAPAATVAPSRRSARQAHKQASANEETPAMEVDELAPSETASPSTLSTTSTYTATPSLLPTSVSVPQEVGNGHKRSRSNSSTVSASSGTSTAVSTPSEGGLSTAVEETASPEASPVLVKGLELTVDEKDEKVTSTAKGKTRSKAKAAPANSRGTKRKRVEEEDQEEKAQEP